MNIKLQYFFPLLIFLPLLVTGQDFTIARVHYGGGGDWYSDPSSLPNLLQYVNTQTNINAAFEEVQLKITDKELYSHPYLYLTGHGNIRFTDKEIIRLREFLLRGAFCMWMIIMAWMNHLGGK